MRALLRASSSKPRRQVETMAREFGKQCAYIEFMRVPAGVELPHGCRVSCSLAIGVSDSLPHFTGRRAEHLTRRSLCIGRHAGREAQVGKSILRFATGRYTISNNRTRAPFFQRDCIFEINCDGFRSGASSTKVSAGSCRAMVGLRVPSMERP